MSVPKVVVFDLGKVLVDFDYGVSAAKIASQSRFTAQQVRHLLDHSPLLYRFETGLLTNEQFYGEVCAACGFSGTLDDFCGTFADIFSEIKPMTAMQAALRAHGVPTYIFSNTNGIAVAHIRKTFPFFTNFDAYIYSYEHGSMKPDAKIYETVERVTGRTGAQIVYLDDRLENFQAGLNRGWRALLHKTPEETIAALRQFGLPVET
ncbi:MAG TPA: HAD family phosphatase [Candidatus Baltobacteraceae bacterium]|jgi:FMN phosphatase YigB (HAD superfamily)|nr:HAD family phosphatase [Candidatus Baltobacteraceae bacterium]